MHVVLQHTAPTKEGRTYNKCLLPSAALLRARTSSSYRTVFRGGSNWELQTDLRDSFASSKQACIARFAVLLTTFWMANSKQGFRSSPAIALGFSAVPRVRAGVCVGEVLRGACRGGVTSTPWNDNTVGRSPPPQKKKTQKKGKRQKAALNSLSLRWHEQDRERGRERDR